MGRQRLTWITAPLLLMAGCTSATPTQADAPTELPAIVTSTSTTMSATTSSTASPTTSTTTSTVTPTTQPQDQSILMTGFVDFESSEFVEMGGSPSGCWLTGEWGNFLFEGAVVQVHDQRGTLLGESVLGRGDTKAYVHCHFPYEVEVPSDAEWYSLCVVGFGPTDVVARDDLTWPGWKTSMVAGGDAPEEPTPCDAFLGSRFGPLDDDGRPPPIDAEAGWAMMRSQWDQILRDGSLRGYTIDYTRLSGRNGESDSRIDGQYRLVISDGVVSYCRFTPSSDSASSNPCDELDGKAFSPVDHFYIMIEEFGREQVAVAFDLEVPIPTLIRHDRADTTGEEFTIRVTWFQGEW